MDVATLLPAKTLNSAKLTTIGVAVAAQGNNYWRVRVSVTTEDFQFLYDPMRKATSPRSQMGGSGYSGLIIQLTSHGGVSVQQQSKSTVVLNASAKDLACTENKVLSKQVSAVLCEYEDGSRYLLTEPLPDMFLTTAVQMNRRANPVPTRAAVMAFAKAGAPLTAPPTRPQMISDIKPMPKAIPPTVSAQLDEAPHAQSLARLVETKIAEPKVIAPPPPIIVDQKPSALLAGTISFEDLKATVEMLNEQTKLLRGKGVNVGLRVDDKGDIRAKVQISYEEEF